MQRYILKRILWMIPILLSIGFIVFMIVNLTPGDIARTILGSEAPQSAVDELREEMGLNQNIIKRYVIYIGNVLRGDFGTSYRSGTPVFKQIMDRFPISLKLSFYAMNNPINVQILSKIEYCLIAVITPSGIPTKTAKVIA